MQCQAKSKRSGQQCKKSAMLGQKYCRNHGGVTKKGVLSQNFQTGRYSKYLPGRLHERYEQSLSDAELLALREEISLVDARVADLLKRVDTGEAGNVWKMAHGFVKEFNMAKSRNQVDEMSIALDNLFSAIEHGKNDYMAWDEVTSLLEQRRRLVESERKRLVEMQQVITVERATLLVFKILDILKRNIPDRQILITVGRELTALLNKPMDERAEEAEVQVVLKKTEG